MDDRHLFQKQLLCHSAAIDIVCGGGGTPTPREVKISIEQACMMDIIFIATWPLIHKHK